MKREEIDVQVQSVIKETKHNVTLYWVFAVMTAGDGISRQVSFNIGESDAKYLAEKLSEK